MSKVAVVYWSQTGNTENMANSVAEGARGAGAEVDVIESTDFDAAKAAAYDAFAFGCPSMGEEVLEEEEFQPMWDDVKGSLSGKKVALFGSYGWGDGEWMQDWVEDAKAAGVDFVQDLICQEEENGESDGPCKEMGAKLA